MMEPCISTDTGWDGKNELVLNKVILKDNYVNCHTCQKNIF